MKAGIVNCLFAAAVTLSSVALAWELPAFAMESLPHLENELPLLDGRTLKETSSNATASSAKKASNATLVKPLSADTEAPTESPAPSPSPSETPTLSPTITDSPTVRPTAAPTESPAPSPSPSETPTMVPSDQPSISPSNNPTVSSPPSNIPSVAPSDLPSLMPSVAPSSAPTVSAQPSSFPSNVPSALPSAQPSISAQPSSSPSAAPTISMMPSSSPTLITQVAAIFTVTLRLESGLLTDKQVSALENATTSFLQTDVTVGSGKLEDIVVQVAGQTVIDVTNVTVATTSNATKSNSTKSKSAKSNSTDRALAATATKSPFFLEQALEIIFSVQSTYTGSDPTLSLHDELVDYFINPDSRWYRWLGAADAVFEPIAPEMTPEEKAVAAAKAAAIAEQESKRQGGNGAVAAASIMSFFALLLGIAAAVFSIRYYRQNNFGQELASPRLTPTSTGLGSRIANENLEYEYSQQMANSSDEANLMKGTKSDEDAGIEVDSATSSWMRPPNSPNSLENGNGVAMDKILQRHRASDLPEQQQLQEQLPPPMQQPQQQQQQAMDDRWSHIQHSNSNTSRTSKDPPTERSEANFPTRQPMQADPRNMTSLFDNNTVMSDMTRSHALPSHMEGGGPPTGRSSGGESAFGASEYSNHARSFFAGLVSGPGTPRRNREKKAEKTKDDGKKMRTVTPTEEIEIPTQTSYDSMTNRAGLYDVFAPPGAIGIVVDTTKHGPAVHALKRNSPMLGLINPGDLIVGLDDEDARGMTAATLTRLMASKSNQKERKITLLTSADNF